MKAVINADLTDLFAERYGQEIPEKDTIETKILDTVGGIFQAKDIGYFERGKRANHAKSRIKVQRHLRKEQRMYLLRAKDIKRHLSVSMGEEELEKLKERYHTKAEKEALRQWMVTDPYSEATNGILTTDLFHDLASESNRDRGHGLRDLLRTIPRTILPEMFIFQSDREFVSNYARKYELLCKGACAEVFLRQLDVLTEKDEKGVPLKVKGKYKMKDIMNANVFKPVDPVTGKAIE